MRKVIVSAVVAVIAAVSFAAPSQAGSYGYKSYGYGHKHHVYSYHPHRKHYGGYHGVKIIIKKKHYGYY